MKIKTETEKAIEFCENVMYKEDVIDCEEDDLLYNEEMRKVITLLQSIDCDNRNMVIQGRDHMIWLNLLQTLKVLSGREV